MRVFFPRGTTLITCGCIRNPIEARARNSLTGLSFGIRGIIRPAMRRVFCGLALCSLLLAALPATSATGRVIKVLPEFLDLQGRSSLAPSLYERDAYQAVLREHPERRAGIRFYVQWKTKGPAWEPL